MPQHFRYPTISIGFFFVFFQFSTFAQCPVSEFPFHPKFEGIYDAQVECTEPEYYCGELEGPFRVAIQNTASVYGPPLLYITFIHGDIATPYYELNGKKVEDHGSHIIAIADGDSKRIIEADITIDPISKTISGLIRDSHFSADLRLSGRQSFSTESLFGGEASSIDPGEFQGSFNVDNTSDKGTLSIRPGIGGYFDFTLYKPWPAGTIRFEFGEFLPECGVLQLVTTSEQFKWIMNVSKDPGYPLRGVGKALVGWGAVTHQVTIDKK